MISENNGKGSFKRIVGIVFAIVLIQIIEMVIIASYLFDKDLPNQKLILYIMEMCFFIVIGALLGITYLSRFSFVNQINKEDETETEILKNT